MVRGQPHTMGRYVLREVVGTGGFATVYRAYDAVLDREVALKVLHPHHARDADTRERFVREGRALARVRHPNMVHVYDAGEADGTAYLAMELVEGRSLSAVLAERGPLSLAEVVEVVDQVATALAALHARNLIHRDIKPANIVYEADSGRIVLLDLGGARALDASVITTSSSLVGTPGFMAPEQVEPGGRATPQTDVYQFGATVYALLTGRPPFEGETTQAIYAIVHLPPPNLAALRPDLPPEVVGVVTEALAKDPARRPQGTLTFARQLRAAAGLAAGPPPAPFVLAPRSPGRTVGAASQPTQPGPAAVESAATQAVAPPGPPPRPRPVERARARPPRASRGPYVPFLLAGVALMIGALIGFGVLVARRGGDDAGRPRPATASPASATQVAAVTRASPTPAPSRSPAPTEPPSPSPSPTEPPAPSPTPAPTAPPTPAPTPPPSPTPAPTAAPNPAPATNAAAVLQAEMEARGYVPSGRVISVPATAAGGVLAAQRGVRSDCGSDKFCQLVFIVWNGRFLGFDTPSPSRVILGVNEVGVGQFSVTYAGYTRDDQDCCPSLPTMTITYTCTASRCTPSDWPPPGHAP